MKQNINRVLLIEPDYSLAKSYAMSFTYLGIESIHEPSAERAIEKLDDISPQVIILELQLKGHNGIEFLHEVRSYADWQEIPIVVHSVIPESESGLTSDIRSQLYVTDYCYKPSTTLNHLSNIVKGLVNYESGCI